MSKIDEYQSAKQRAKSLRSFADNISDTKHVDKFGMSFEILDTWLGYYGSSSAYEWTDAQKEEVSRQISIDLHLLVERAAQRVEVDAEKARREARAEAQEILSDIDSQKNPSA